MPRILQKGFRATQAVNLDLGGINPLSTKMISILSWSFTAFRQLFPWLRISGLIYRWRLHRSALNWVHSESKKCKHIMILRCFQVPASQFRQVQSYLGEIGSSLFESIFQAMPLPSLVIYRHQNMRIIDKKSWIMLVQQAYFARDSIYSYWFRALFLLISYTDYCQTKWWKLMSLWYECLCDMNWNNVGLRLVTKTLLLR